MTTLIFVFIAALVSSLVLTPLIRTIAIRFNTVHPPTDRCSHTAPKPRIGGIAIYLSFALSLVLCLLFQTKISAMIHDTRYLTIVGGATLMFLIGLLDDLYQLKPLNKLLLQFLAAFMTWYGGVQINAIMVSLTGAAHLGWLSMPATIFWILLVTNAINLIDGLDGLAAGVTLFVSMMMLVLCIVNENYLVAVSFAALAGSTLGFLRYNFNPASIFMGDGGSYFLGYMLATLSIIGLVKGQTALAMLIPLVALGVPIFDALISPLRRFIRGKDIFSPDHKHLHHKIMDTGASHRRTVLILYVVTVVLSISAFGLIYFRDERAALILLVPAVLLFLLFHKIGYLNYFAIDKMYGWLRDIGESSNISQQSRSFLDLQIEIQKSRTIDEMWMLTKSAFDFLKLDQAVLILAHKPGDKEDQSLTFLWKREAENEAPPEQYHLKIDYPLMVKEENTILLGRLVIHKYLDQSPSSLFTTRRLEQIQRILTKKIAEFRKQDSSAAVSQDFSTHY